MRQVATDGSAIADLRVRDMRQRLVDERQVARRGGVALEAPIAGERTDTQASCAVLLHPGALGQRIDVDQQRRLRQPEIHCRNKALAAGKEPPLVAMFGLELQGLLKGAGGDVPEGRGLHAREATRKLAMRVCAKVWKRSPG